LSPLEQMRVVCYRDAYREASPGVVENLHARIAPKVQKIGGGSPTRNAIRQLLEQVDADPAWYPGKAAVLAHAGKRSGPEPALSGAKKRCIANSAMAAKEEGLEPTYALAVARCPKAVVNCSRAVFCFPAPAGACGGTAFANHSIHVPRASTVSALTAHGATF
jgi:hypothetical protein